MAPTSTVISRRSFGTVLKDAGLVSGRRFCLSMEMRMTENQKRVIEDADRYLKINTWLRDRYRDKKTGWLYTQKGDVLSRYTVLDRAFFDRYLRNHCS